jgi:hypothetical protein
MTLVDRRRTAALGLLSTALNTAALALFGVPPKVGTASNQEFAVWITDHRATVLAASVIFTLAWTCSLGFLTGLRTILREAEDGRSLLADVGLSAAVALFAVVGVGAVAPATAAVLAGSAGGVTPEVAHFAIAALLVTFALSAGPTLLLVGAFATAMLRTRAVPAWAGWGLVAVGVIHIGALVSVARTGVFAPEGLFAIGAPSAFEAWQALTALAILRPGGVVTPSA